MKRVEWVVEGDTVRGTLYTAPGKRANPAPLIVMIHGLASCQVEFYDFPEKLMKAGYAVLTFDYRGHGESGGERGVLSVERARADLMGALEAMKAEYMVDTTRFVLIGHSTGAGIAAHVADYFPNLRVLVLLAPVARLQDEMNAFEFVGYNLARVVNAPMRLISKKGISVPYKVDYKRLYSTETAIKRAQKDDFLQHTIPVKNYRPLVQQLDAEKAAKDIPQPTLVMVAEYDIVVGKYNSRRVYDAIQAPKKFVEVPKSGHSMCGDARSGFVAKHILEFLTEHLEGAPVP